MFEFNPKGHSLLDDQLTESGLEMNIVITPALAAAGISGVTSIVGGIFGAKKASDQNKKAQAAQDQQQQLLNKQAKLQNEYNEKKFEADKENYRKQAEYNFQTAVKNWQYNMTLRALEEKSNAQQYLMNVENSQKQLTFNEIAAQQAQSREQLALNDAKAEYRFNAQDQLVAQLQAQGKARLGQAGRSMQKRVQSNEAQIGRDLAVMSASLTGEINASHLRMFDINMGKYTADANVEAARMLRPDRLPDIPAPTKPPEPTWVEPMQIIPGMAKPAATQSVAMPLIQGFGSAASSLASVDWSSGSTDKLLPPPGPSNQQFQYNPSNIGDVYKSYLP